MTFNLVAPEPEYNNVLILPSPVLGNTEALGFEVDYKESMDGTTRTYVRNSRTRIYIFDFENIGRGKMLEAQEFLRLFVGEIMILDWGAKPEVNGRVILNQDATVFSNDKLTINGGGPRTESGNFTLAFIGVL